MAEKDLRSNEDLVDSCNDMLSRMHVAHRVRHWSEINANTYVTLYEGVCGEILPDKIPNAKNREDDVHNCQAVIDSLSLDVLNTTLSHITGEDVVRGNKIAIGNLLDVFQGLMEYLLDKIESSIDNGDVHNGTVHSEDPDMVTSEVIDSILERELGGSRARSNGQLKVSWEDTRRSRARERSPNMSRASRTSANGKKTSSHSGKESFSTAVDYLSRSNGDAGARRDRDLTYSGYDGDASSTRDSTADLIRVSEQIRARVEKSTAPRRKADETSPGVADNSMTSSVAFPEPVAAAMSSDRFDQLGMRPRGHKSMAASLREGKDAAPAGGTHHTFTHHLYLHYDKSPKLDVDPLSASLPIAPVSSLASLLAPHALTNYNNNSADDVNVPERDIAQSGSSGRRQTANDEFARSDRLQSSAPGNLQYENSAGGSRQSRSYENLHHMMHDTVTMSRQALSGSPLREKNIPTAVNGTDNIDEELSRVLRSSVHIRDGPSNGSYGHEEDKDESRLQSILSPTKKASSTRENDYKRKVSFRPARGAAPKKPSPRTKETATRARPSPKSPQKEPVASPSNKRPSRGPKRPRPDGESLKQQSNALPVDFHQYLLKYYGKDHRIPSAEYTDSHADGYHSDGNVDYTPDAQKPSDFAIELERARDELQRKAKGVRLDDILDDSAPGRMGPIRRKLKDEDINSRFKAEFLGKVYQDELMDYEEEIDDLLEKQRKSAHDKEKEYKKKVLVGPKTNKYKPPKKYTSGSVLLSRPSRPKSRPGRGRKRSASASPTLIRSGPKSVYDSEILPWLLEEFPYLHLSSETLQELWKKSAKQIEQLSHAERAVNSRKTKAQRQTEEAERRQKILLEIMRKELTQNQRLKDIKERQRLSQTVKSKMREKRQQSARCRKYYDEYQVRNRAKMLKKRSKEEMIFKKLFKDGLDIQKDRIRDLRKYAKEQRDTRAVKQQNELESLENYYRDQFSMLGDAMKQERDDLELREKAQDKVVTQMRKELRKKMESEIQSFQTQLYRDEDDAYWRDLDAERVRHELHLAKYKAKV